MSSRASSPGRDAARLTATAAEASSGSAPRSRCSSPGVRSRATGGASGSDAILPEQWFARLSGCSESEARRELRISEQLAELPATEAKLREGSLSLDQAALVTRGAAADPSAERQLLRTARKGEMRNLRAETERVVAAATDETEGRAAAHRERHLRTWTRGFATEGAFSGPTDQVAVLLDALKPLEREAFDAARKADDRESRDAYRFDALIGLAARHAGADAGTTKADRPVARVRVDLARTPRRQDHPGEVCEIPGVGPVPVEHARKVLSPRAARARDHRRRRRPDRGRRAPPATSPRHSRSRSRNATRPATSKAATAPTTSNDITSKAASPNTTSRPTSCSATPAPTTTTSSPTSTTT